MLLRHRKSSDTLRRLLRNASGNVAIIFALTLLPILLAVGAAVDYGHGNAVRVRIQAALDATGLMVAQGIGTMPADELLDQADEMFAVNFIDEQGVAIGPLEVNVSGDVVTLSASAVVETTLMALGGIYEMNVGASTEIVRSEDSYEVVLVLDNTGSMGRNGKLQALQESTELLIDNLFGEADVHPLLDMGIVPFSHAVNVGTDNEDASWMDTLARNPLHRENFDDEFVDQGLTRFDLFDRFRNAEWAGCVEARAYPLDVTDAEATGANPSTLFVPYFAPDEPGDDYSGRGRRIDDYDNTYLDDQLDRIDRRATETERQEYTLKYTDGVSVRGRNSSYGPNYGCNARPILPLTNRKNDVLSAVEGMQASGYTNITEGLMWGMRTISPGEPFSQGKAYGTEDHHKIIILLTDGRNQYYNDPGWNNENKSQYGPYGFMKSGRLVDSRSLRTIEAKMNERTAEACEAVKDEDIVLFTITFQADDRTTENLMRDCATEPSMYYDSPDAATLRTVFKSIATRISELRISK